MKTSSKRRTTALFSSLDTAHPRIVLGPTLTHCRVFFLRQTLLGESLERGIIPQMPGVPRTRDGHPAGSTYNERGERASLRRPVVPRISSDWAAAALLASLTGSGLPPGRARLRPPPRAAEHPPAGGPCG